MNTSYHNTRLSIQESHKPGQMRYRPLRKVQHRNLLFKEQLAGHMFRALGHTGEALDAAVVRTPTHAAADLAEPFGLTENGAGVLIVDRVRTAHPGLACAALSALENAAAEQDEPLNGLQVDRLLQSTYENYMEDWDHQRLHARLIESIDQAEEPDRLGYVPGDWFLSGRAPRNPFGKPAASLLGHICHITCAANDSDLMHELAEETHLAAACIVFGHMIGISGAAATSLFLGDPEGDIGMDAPDRRTMLRVLQGIQKTHARMQRNPDPVDRLLKEMHLAAICQEALRELRAPRRPRGAGQKQAQEHASA